uniref:Uncharacterized protein n=1 Tax=Leptobrachium leishanense TaxID=445787 RepID=A0A8C5PPF7_9ANUR
MVRTKGSTNSQKTPAKHTRAAVRPLDEFLVSTPRSMPSTTPPKMADAAAPASSQDPTAAITRLERRLESLLAGMPTKSDLAEMLTDLRGSFQHDVEEVRGEVAALSSRVTHLENTAPVQAPSTNDAAHGFSGLRRLVDDLDNRGRRANIRIRGLWEPDQPENLDEVLGRLFTAISGREIRPARDLPRAHRALRPRPQQGEPPRDVICCFSNFRLKEVIMQRVRNTRTWDFEGQQLELFNDLSAFTLAARRHLRPITQTLRHRNVPYRWGFPFSLMVRLDGVQHTIYCPKDVPDFLEALHMAPLEIPDWEREEPGGRAPRQQRQPQRRRTGGARGAANPDQ